MSGNNDTVYLVNGSTLTNIANAIRTKTGKSGSLYPSEMDEEITSISTGYQPITVNITQSEHQTITANSKPNLNVTNGKIVCPSSITINASITADDGYTPGTLNQTSVVANWGDTVTFSATPAEEIIIKDITLTAASDTKPYDGYELINDGYTLDGELFEGHSMGPVTVEGSQTEPGSSENVITDFVIYDESGRRIVDIETYYNVTLVPGTLTVTEDVGEPVITFNSDVTEGVALGDSVTLWFEIEATNGYVEGGRYSIWRVINSNTESVIDTFEVPLLHIGESFNNDNSAICTYTWEQRDVDNGYVNFKLKKHITGNNYNIIDEIEVLAEEAEPHISISYEVTSSPSNGVEYELGETININITVENDGNVTLHDVEYGSELTDDPWLRSTFNVGETLNHSISYTLTEAEILAGECVIDLYANAYDPQDTLHNFNDDCTIANIESPNGELTINAQVSSNPANATTGYKPGETVSFNVNVTNTGNLTLTDISVTNDLISGEWTIESLEPGDYVQLDNPYPTYDVTTNDNGNITTTFTASVTSPDPDDPDASVIISTVTFKCAYKAGLPIMVNYASGGQGTCSYSGTVAGNSVSGTITGSTVISGYEGEAYNIRLSNPPSGYRLSINSIAGTFSSSNPPKTVILIAIENEVPIEE